MAAFDGVDVPPQNMVDRTGERELDEMERTLKPAVAEKVRTLRERRPSIRPNGIFHHPKDWTQEEMDFIADSLKANVPIYTIAKLVHCEKHTLSRLIKHTPELLELKNDQHENILDEAEYQADRLAKAGNASIIMYILQTLGRKRGWSTQDMPSEGGGEATSRIVMGEIPLEEVKRANETVASKRAPGEADPNDVNNILTDPVKLQAVKDVVSEEVSAQMKKNGMDAIDVEGRSSSPLGEGESVVDMERRMSVDQYSNMGGGFDGGMGDDPFADGANSMFFQ